jgi:hypothetical protein
MKPGGLFVYEFNIHEAKLGRTLSRFSAYNQQAERQEAGRMNSSWETQTGHLTCRWSEIGQSVEYNPLWIQENSDVQCSYLPPVPDFASHSPFGGASWFQHHTVDRNFNV